MSQITLPSIRTRRIFDPGVYLFEIDKVCEVKSKAEDIRLITHLVKSYFKRPIAVDLSLSKAPLWKFKSFLMATGTRIKGNRIDLNNLLHKRFVGEVIVEGFRKDGRKRFLSRITSFSPECGFKMLLDKQRDTKKNLGKFLKEF